MGVLQWIILLILISILIWIGFQANKLKGE